MLEIFIKSVLPVLVTLIVGAAGWLMAHTIGKDFITFYNLRARALEANIVAANVTAIHFENPDLKPIYYEAEKELRRLSAQITALSVCANWFASWYFTRCGYDLTKAASGLIGLSNSLSAKDGTRMFHEHRIETGLKLPHKISADVIEETRRIEAGR